MIMQIYLNLYNACQVYVVECAFKIKSFLSIILYYIHGAMRLQLTQFPCDDP